MEKICVVLIGNIGSGKSTFTSALVAMDYIAIARDRVRYSIGGGSYLFNPAYEPAVHKINMYTFRQFLTLEKNLVIDETNVNVSMRADYILDAKNRGYKVVAIEFPRYSKEVSVTRRMSHNHGTGDAAMWGMVWDRFNNRYKSPTKQEGFDHIITLNADVPAHEVWRLIGAQLYGS